MSFIELLNESKNILNLKVSMSLAGRKKWGNVPILTITWGHDGQKMETTKGNFWAKEDVMEVLARTKDKKLSKFIVDTVKSRLEKKMKSVDDTPHDVEYYIEWDSLYTEAKRKFPELFI